MIGRNINDRNKNGLFSTHTPPTCPAAHSSRRAPKVKVWPIQISLLND